MRDRQTEVRPVAYLAHLSRRLVNRRILIRREWEKIQAGGSRATLDRALLQWLNLMERYFHGGGQGRTDAE